MGQSAHSPGAAHVEVPGRLGAEGIELHEVEPGVFFCHEPVSLTEGSSTLLREAKA